MDSQDDSYRDPPSSPREIGIPVDNPSNTEDDCFHHLASEDSGEPSVSSPDTVLGSPPTYEASLGPEIRHQHEIEATEILCSQQFQLIQRLLRFRLFGQKDSLRHTLQHRTCNLDKILVLLKDNGQSLAELEKNQKVDTILELVEPTRNSSDIGWRWSPYNAAGMDAQQIATKINEESYSLFRRIRFEDWVRYLMGYEEAFVEEMFSQHTVLTCRLHSYLLRHGNESENYTQVAEILRNRSPLAYQAVLQSMPPGSYLPISSSLPFGLEPIFGPLRGVLEDGTQPLSAKLKILPILAIRFNHTYTPVTPFAWPQLKPEVQIFKALIAGEPAKYAEDITISDKKDFDRLSPEAFKTGGPHLIYMFRKANSFSHAIAECCEAYPGLRYHLSEIAQELYRYRNWYRLIALLNGLLEAGSANLVYPWLITSDDNFAACRAQMKARPGLPFLLPYRREYIDHGDAVMSEAFSFISYSMEAEPAQSADTGFSRHFMARILRAL